MRMRNLDSGSRQTRASARDQIGRAWPIEQGRLASRQSSYTRRLERGRHHYPARPCACRHGKKSRLRSRGIGGSVSCGTRCLSFSLEQFHFSEIILLFYSLSALIWLHRNKGTWRDIRLALIIFARSQLLIGDSAGGFLSALALNGPACARSMKPREVSVRPTMVCAAVA